MASPRAADVWPGRMVRALGPLLLTVVKLSPSASATGAAEVVGSKKLFLVRQSEDSKMTITMWALTLSYLRNSYYDLARLGTIDD